MSGGQGEGQVEAMRDLAEHIYYELSDPAQTATPKDDFIAVLVSHFKALAAPVQADQRDEILDRLQRKLYEMCQGRAAKMLTWSEINSAFDEVESVQAEVRPAMSQVDPFEKDAQERVFRNLEKYWKIRASKLKRVGSPHVSAVLLDCVRDLQKAIDRFNAIRALDAIKDAIQKGQP